MIAPTLSDALRDATRRLAAAGSETPRLDADVLLGHVLGLDRGALLARLRDPLPAFAADAFARLVAERERRAPVAYLTGRREFMGLPFRAAPGALVPRPETELLVEWAVGRLRASPPGTVLDIGTGSGAIACSLAAALPANWSGQVVAADVSTAALAVARANRDALGLASRVWLVRGDLATWCVGGVGLLLANLPYLTPEQIAGNPWLAPEPRLALDGGPDGLALIRRLIADLPRLLAPGGAAGLEIDPSQAGTVATLLNEALPCGRVAIVRDLAGLDRHVVVELPVEAGEVRLTPRP